MRQNKTNIYFISTGAKNSHNINIQTEGGPQDHSFHHSSDSRKVYDNLNASNTNSLILEKDDINSKSGMLTNDSQVNQNSNLSIGLDSDPKLNVLGKRVEQQ